MKTFSERLLDYVQKHPCFDIDSVHDYVLDKHKRAIWKLQQRVSDRIENMLTGNLSVFFLTFTFSDEYLPIPEHERRTEAQIIAFMDAQGVSAYVANTDYGKENGRFHWHAVVQSTHNMDSKLWKYGAINFKKVPKTSLSIKLSKYLIKLKRHAIKVMDPQIIYGPRYYR